MIYVFTLIIFLALSVWIFKLGNSLSNISIRLDMHKNNFSRDLKYWLEQQQQTYNLVKKLESMITIKKGKVTKAEKKGDR